MSGRRFMKFKKRNEKRRPKLCLKCGLPTDLCMCKEKEQEEKRITIQGAKQMTETKMHNLLKDADLLEMLSELEHKQWIEWSKTVAKKEKLSKERLKRWRTCWKPYAKLSEEQKQSDRKYAKKVLKIISDWWWKQH